MNQVIKYFQKGANMMEAIKITVLVSGIIFGVVRDFTSSEFMSLYEMTQKDLISSALITNVTIPAHDFDIAIEFSEFKN